MTAGRTRGGQYKFTSEQMAAALRQAKGMTTVAARLLRCNVSTVENYVKADPMLAEVRRAEREAMLDLGELALIRAVQRGEAWAVCFLLKTQGKKRGYVERAEISGPEGGAIELEVSNMSDEQRAERISGLLDLARERARRAERTGDDSAASG